jgi:hypothetical protein
MTKKQMLKLSIMLIGSGIIGAVVTLALIQLAGSEVINIGPHISQFFNDHTIEMHIILFALLMFPTLFFHYKGKDLYKNIENYSDEEMEIIEKKINNYLGLSMTLNSIFIVLNFMLFGILFKNTSDSKLVIAVIFMVGQLFTTGVELTTIKFIKKIDERLKGDPTSMRFAKDFLESCDEAQKLKIYKSGHQAFQFSKFFAMVLVVMTILLNLVFDIGGLTVFISCLYLLVQMVSYSYYETRS